MIDIAGGLTGSPMGGCRMPVNLQKNPPAPSEKLGQENGSRSSMGFRAFSLAISCVA